MRIRCDKRRYIYHPKFMHSVVVVFGVDMVLNILISP